MRRKALAVIVLILLFIPVLGCEDKIEEKSEALSIEERLVGEWKDNKSEGSFIFNEDKSVMVVFENIVLSSNNEVEVFWKVGEMHDPIHLNLVSKKIKDGSEIIFPMIVRFLTEDKIQICIPEDGSLNRPANFFDTDEKYSLILIKQ